MIATHVVSHNLGQTFLSQHNRVIVYCTAIFSAFSLKMVKRCCWGTCNSDTRYPERVVNIKFIPFPKPKTNYDGCLRWIKACGRPNDQLNVNKITKDIYVCSKHFMNGQPSETFPDPLPATGVQVYQARRRPKKRKTCESSELACEDKGPDGSLSQDTSVQNEKGTQTEEVIYYNLDFLAYTSTIHDLEQERETLHQEIKDLNSLSKRTVW